MSTESGSNLNKVYESSEAALAGLSSGASLLVGGFGGHGEPRSLLRAVQNSGAGDLTVICQGATPSGTAPSGIDHLVEAGQIRKIVSPLPFDPRRDGAVRRAWESSRLELEVMPTGVMAERIRAGGAGIGGFFLPTGAGTRFSEGREIGIIEGQEYIYQPPLKADFALLRASIGDSMGNLLYSGTGRNWNPVMAMAARVSIAEVDEILRPGEIDPELVITPAIFVQRIVLAQPPN